MVGVPRDSGRPRWTPQGVGRYAANATVRRFREAGAGRRWGQRSRLSPLSRPPLRPPGDLGTVLWEEVARATPPNASREWNWAVLDLAAEVCLPAKPRCGACPLGGRDAPSYRSLDPCRPPVLASGDGSQRCDSPRATARGGPVAAGKRRARPGSAGRVVELFAGVGGFRLGLEPHGWETVWASQWEPSTKTQHAADCYRSHFEPDVLSNEDINAVVEEMDREGWDHFPTMNCSLAGSPARTTRWRRSAARRTGSSGRRVCSGGRSRASSRTRSRGSCSSRTSTGSSSHPRLSEDVTSRSSSPVSRTSATWSSGES